MSSSQIECVARLQELFEAALEFEGEARGRYLQQQCGSDVALRSHVERLLAADAAEDSMLESPVLQRAENLSSFDTTAENRIPSRVGRYQIEQIIAAGGMGTVYRATQENPRRRVAVKLMRHGLTSRSARQRFQYESELLARLSHPGIAQIFEAGIHEEDDVRQPFFAMEHIDDARPITRYVEEKGVSIRARLELFADACNAVHHGHQLGVIHRDLKPANILVDGEGRVKVIDFGVARSTTNDARASSIQTVDGQLIGTLSYMSPEQTRADSTRIDTRSDVYSLGVVLYEMLAGELPYDATDSNIVEAARVIQQQLPKRLSSIDLKLGGDLECIVNKTLEKAPERRYRSAAELADDLRRYLRGEAITARPPSLMYELQVLIRRNRAAVSSALLVLVTLVIGLVSTMVFWIRAEREQQRAQEREAAAVEALQLVDILFEAASVGDVMHEGDAVQSILEDVEKSFAGGQFARYPEIELKIHDGLAKVYASLGSRKALPHYRRVVALEWERSGATHKETLRAQHRLARYLAFFDGQLEQAEQLARQTWMTCKRAHPNDTALASRLGYFLALKLLDLGKLDEAEPLIRADLARVEHRLGRESFAFAGRILALSRVKLQRGEVEEMETLARESVGIFERLEPNHPMAGHSKWALAQCLTRMACMEEAEEQFLRAEVTLRGALHRNHPTLERIRRALIEFYEAWGKPTEADLWRRQLKTNVR